MIRFFNLWLFYLAGYVFSYIFQEWANRKRGEPFDDPEFLFRDKKTVPIALLWLFGGLAIALFVPLNLGLLFYVGLAIVLIGLAVSTAGLYSFAHHSGLTTSGIHRYSRNPLYLGTIVFLLGLTVMGFSGNDLLWSLIFLAYCVVSIPYLHWTITLEEQFLSSKYGSPYLEYLRNTHRYIGITEKKSE
jgi:protein-S-isoprenylcysteine O-methyltransferase Ste14